MTQFLHFNIRTTYTRVRAYTHSYSEFRNKIYLYYYENERFTYGGCLTYGALP